MHGVLHQLATKAAEFIGRQCPFDSVPKVAVVLGSGFRAFSAHVSVAKSLALSDIPGFVAPKVSGHGGELLFAESKGQSVILLTGRSHLYEGHDVSQVVHPVRSLGKLGVRSIILTNAAGGLSRDLIPGSLMMIRDQLNLSGQNCLTGEGVEAFGKRFVDMVDAYDSQWMDRLNSIRSMPRGVYAGLLGPTYETPAETAWLAQIGATMVGMSTVQECIAARQMGMKVLGMSLITNLAGGLSAQVDHQEVLDAGKKAEALLRGALEQAIVVAP
jgi:purine-nucleoside phosphorylase